MSQDFTAPYWDPSLPVDRRVEDLLGRMSLEDKAGLMFQDMVIVGADGQLAGDDNRIGKPATERAIRELRMTHFNLLGAAPDVRELAQWHNRLQESARSTGLGIPVTLSTDPRNAFSSNPGTAAKAGPFSQWPESLGLAALRDPALVERFADSARQEYLSVGLRSALHPQIDLATEPRWARIGMTFGEDADLTSQLVTAYIRGFQGTTVGKESVSTMTKHFPGGGPQKDGEDPHFEYGREQVYPGGRFDYHLKPFIAAIEAGAAQIMPYYGMPVDTEYEEVAFGFNKGIITGLLRERLGFQGIVCTDWGLLTDGVIMGQTMPARAWGVEHLSPAERVEKALDAGVDQFGGESVPELIIGLVRNGRVAEERLDVSVRRLLSEKFRLGLFENPFVDVDNAARTVGRADFVAAGQEAQRAAITRLTETTAGAAALPLSPDRRVYLEGFNTDAGRRLGTVVQDPNDADVAVLRLAAPFEPRSGGFEAFFHAGSLEFSEAERDRILAICSAVPTIIDLYLDRPAIIPEIADAAGALIVNFGASDEALADVLLGIARARGRLPFDLPSSTRAVVESCPDVPFDTLDPLFRFGEGLGRVSLPGVEL
ncbi:glycoside hydrolase family 3 protein [Arthrobacter sp. AQ5-06]|nr:glycoside hydrolase family 3 protein [Arthrobacter sp. AQ5-06]